MLLRGWWHRVLEPQPTLTGTSGTPEHWGRLSPSRWGLMLGLGTLWDCSACARGTAGSFVPAAGSS